MNIFQSSTSRATTIVVVVPLPFAGIVNPGISFVLNVAIPAVPSFAKLPFPADSVAIDPLKRISPVSITASVGL